MPGFESDEAGVYLGRSIEHGILCNLNAGQNMACMTSALLTVNFLWFDEGRVERKMSILMWIMRGVTGVEVRG